MIFKWDKKHYQIRLSNGTYMNFSTRSRNPEKEARILAATKGHKMTRVWEIVPMFWNPRSK